MILSELLYLFPFVSAF
ncbi:hypothetical protein OIU77_030494 [Salix suchowensis]|uniref:Uncharacterized protein n=1 Tax=Salix suchowensis TaxID=1278906 RepID=A0ABQ9BE47_9ROSI|nr:hypothetical protein OIU77_030494 [Salix suchowensis]